MTVIFVLLNNVFIKFGFYTNYPEILELGTYGSLHSFMTVSDILKEILKAIFFGAHVELGGTFWFFKALFSVACSYYLIEYCINKVIGNKTGVTLKIQSVLSVFFLMLGFLCSIYGVSIFSMARSLSIYGLYHCGRLIKYRQLNRYCVNRVFAILSFIVLIGLSFLGQIRLDLNSYVNPIFLTVASFSGWCLVNYFSEVALNSNWVTHFLSTCGQASLYIMIFHLVSFKLVNIVQVWIYELPEYYVAAFPVLYRNGIWAIVYSAVGVIIPLCIYKCKKIIHRKG